MQVGDLIAHKRNGMFGLIVSTDCGKFGDDLYRIIWVDGFEGACFEEDVKVINEYR